MLINQLKEALDSARGQIEIYDQYKDLNEHFTRGCFGHHAGKV